MSKKVGLFFERLQGMRDYLRLAFDCVPIAADRRDRFTRAMEKCLEWPALWRLDHHFFGFPFDSAINDRLKRRVALKPAVDARRLEPRTAC